MEKPESEKEMREALERFLEERSDLYAEFLREQKPPYYQKAPWGSAQGLFGLIRARAIFLDLIEDLDPDTRAHMKEKLDQIEAIETNIRQFQLYQKPRPKKSA